MGGFWGIEVKPGQEYPIEFPEDEEVTLRITQATLGLGKSKERTIVQCTIGDKSPIFLCSLLPKKNESCPLNLEFEDDDELVTFSVIGDQSVHLSGYLVAYDEGEPVGEGYESDSYGEDVDEYESGESSDFSSDGGSYDMLSDDLDMYDQPRPSTKSGVVIEEIEDDDKLTNDKGQSKRLVKNGSEDNTSQHQVVKRSAAAPVLESEDEDGFPVSTKTNSQKPESATEQKDKVTEKNKKKEKTSGDAAGMKRKGETIDQDQQERQKKDKKKNKQLHEGTMAEKEKQPEVLKNTNEKSPDINMDSVSTETPRENKKNKNKKKAQKSGEKTNVDQTPSSMEKINGKSSKADQTPPSMEKTGGKSSKVKSFPNGLVVEEVAMGRPDGKRADLGKKVGVCYIGKLKNGKIFDSNMGKRPFEFRLGVGQVISGWDVGVKGMRVGDKRKLTIPPSMGYGQKGAPPAIPPNSWLIFDVELVTVN